MTSGFWVAGSLIILGGVIRLSCFRSLGRFFVYGIAIRPQHKLVVSGLYGIVRHPGYTGCSSLLLGVILWTLGPDAFIRKCGLKDASSVLPLADLLWFSFLAYTIMVLLFQGPVEDKILQDHFGKEWDDYARRVPCSFIPGVI